MIRRAVPDDLPAIARSDGRAFGMHYSEQDLADFRPLFDPERFLLACDQDDGGIVGIAGSFPFDVTLPGAPPITTEGVSWVAVAPTHRRRGILRTLFTEQHRGFVADGIAISVLTASEGGIYGRFGYAPATASRWVEIERRRAEFRAGVPDPGGVRYVEAEEMRALAPGIHRRWCARTPAALSRSDRWWDNRLLDREHHRGGGTARFHLVHPDGYAAYRIDHSSGTCNVVEYAAATDEAHVALWRVLLGLDLVKTIGTSSLPADDPLPFLLTDPRQVRTTAVADGMWARVLDVPAALAARRYAVEVDLVIDVTDPFLDRGGRFRLRGGPDGAECAATTAAPDLHADVAALGGLVFGGTRVHALARAGLVQLTGATAADDALLRRFDAACTSDREPVHGTSF